ncbi:MAG: geranylgeranyl pyrophosphate synthase, partial [Microbacterium sp.]|nr:geranylgeranyl pyrophosphate synthase [Microbacterium sp.]
AQRELDASGAREQLVTLIGQTLSSVRRRAAELPPAARALIDQLADGIEGRIP